MCMRRLDSVVAEVLADLGIDAGLALQSEGAREERAGVADEGVAPTELPGSGESPRIKLIHVSDRVRPCRGGNAVCLVVVK